MTSTPEELMRPKVSFLVPAHNEEKLIGKALDALAKLKNDFPMIEVLVGLDGCTDRTEEIVRSYPFARVFIFPARSGKQTVIKLLKQEASGDIIFMNDADWHIVADHDSFARMVACFDDPKVGGLGDHFTTSFDEEKVKRVSSLLYLGDAWTSLSTLQAKMERCVKIVDGKAFVDPSKPDFMFYVHIYRKNAVDDQQTLCDDGERMIQMLGKGYTVRLLDIESKPYMKASYDSIGFRGFFKQRFRGFVAQRQISMVYPSFNGGSIFSYRHTLFQLGRNLVRIRRFRGYLGLVFWWAIAVAAFIKFRISPPAIGTTEGWKLRASRW